MTEVSQTAKFALNGIVRSQKPWQTVELRGMPLACIRAEDLVDLVFRSLKDGTGGWLITANIDFLRRYEFEPDVRELYDEADAIVADGAPLIWAARLAGSPLPGRVAGADLVWEFAGRAAQDGRSLYLLGGQEDAAPRAASVLSRRFPTLRIAGWSSPLVGLPPSADELDAIRRELERIRPDLLYVALGSPKQEYVIRALRASLPSTWMAGVGISLSFIAGDVSRAPRPLQVLGLEWLHRMAQEPRRLSRRYLLQDLPYALALLARAPFRRRSEDR